MEIRDIAVLSVLIAAVLQVIVFLKGKSDITSDTASYKEKFPISIKGLVFGTIVATILNIVDIDIITTGYLLLGGTIWGISLVYVTIKKKKKRSMTLQQN